jgi:hypothetical protein
LATRNNDLGNKENPANDLGREVNEFWWERPAQMAAVDGQVMTSLVVDPPNGRVPLLPHTSKALPPDPNRADNPEDRNPGERCLGHPAGPPMVGGATGGNPCLQVVQTPGYVVLYSVGWWEGDTLVVESTNFESGTNLRGFGVAPGMGVFTRPDFHLIERFSLAAHDVLLYEFTVTNPKFFAQPWTARAPMARTDARMFEYACHEGNYGLEFIRRGARAAEKDQGRR